MLTWLQRDVLSDDPLDLVRTTLQILQKLPLQPRPFQFQEHVIILAFNVCPVQLLLELDCLPYSHRTSTTTRRHHREEALTMSLTLLNRNRRVVLRGSFGYE
jgi:hypothetical protein